jgi:hypothetical protein
VRETGGNQTLMGCFVLAICGWQHGRHPPRFGSNAIIDENGMLFSNMQNAEGAMFANHCLGDVKTVVDSFKGLADHLKLDDKERIEMFDELRKWIKLDKRANQTNEERGLQQ